jgi:UDP:flavonoid glycosyltransferase YjiC (YdhE family)
MRRRQVLFAVHDWGLGHATRDLVLIHGLLDAGYAVTVLSNGRALALLRQELGESCSFVALRDIPKPLGRRAFGFYVRMSLSLPWVFATFRRERRMAEALHRERHFDFVVSDSRYGVCLDQVPSYYLVHSLRQIIPGRPRQLERLVEASQRHLLSHARRILIPDEREAGLAGELCHRLDCDWGAARLAFIGILSSIRQRPLPQDLDVFVSVSGAEPQRTYFEQRVLEQVAEVPGRIVVALGRPDATARVRHLEGGRIAVHDHLDRKGVEDTMNRARLVVTRSGYTTLMELAELRRKALLVPTVGQSEQEYLGERLERLGRMHCVRQRDLSLARDVEQARDYAGPPPLRPSRDSVDRFLAAVAG